MKLLKILFILSIFFIASSTYSTNDETPSSKAKEEAEQEAIDAIFDYSNQSSSSKKSRECIFLQNPVARAYDAFRQINNLMIDLELGYGGAFTQSADRDYKDGHYPLVGINLNYLLFSYMFNFRYLMHKINDSDESVNFSVLTHYIGIEFKGLLGMYFTYSYLKYNFDTLHKNKNIGVAFQVSYPIFVSKDFSSRVFIRYNVNESAEDEEIKDKVITQSYLEGGIKIGIGLF